MALDNLTQEQKDAEEAKLLAAAAAIDEENKAKGSQSDKDEDMIAKLVQAKLDESLQDIKGKLDSSFKARDEALKKVAEYEAKEKEANLARLKEEGKHKEAYELQLAEEKAKREVSEKRVTELTRDVSVRDVLKSYSFKNDNAADIAYREVVANLVQTESGTWVHRSGVSIKDFVKAYAEDEDNSFLFKVKANSGNGSSSNGTNNPNTGSPKKSLFEYTQAEVLKMAEEGKLP